MNYSTGIAVGESDSTIKGTSDLLVVWDHRRSPGCSDSRIGLPPRPPWVPFDNGSHYPPRHNGRMTGLFHDTHVEGIRPTKVRVRNFRQPGSFPLVPEYPGE